EPYRHFIRIHRLSSVALVPKNPCESILGKPVGRFQAESSVILFLCVRWLRKTLKSQPKTQMRLSQRGISFKGRAEMFDCLRMAPPFEKVHAYLSMSDSVPLCNIERVGKYRQIVSPSLCLMDSQRNADKNRSRTHNPRDVLPALDARTHLSNPPNHEY